MTDRTTKVTLVANVSGYIANFEKAALVTRTVGTEAEKLAQKKAGIQQLGTAFLAIGAVAAAGVFLAVKSFADFDAKMSQVKTLSHATADEMDGLRASALHMGQAIGFSATQVADAEIELVKAGISVSDIMGGALQGALQLAAAGQIDVGKATEIATIALTQFGLKGKDVPHVADLLAAGADKALGGVADLGEALKSGGLVASQFGVSLDETVGTLSAFANAGLLGETAGTDLRQMLLKLGNPAKESSDKLKELGISIYGASGQFVGISNLSGQLQDKLSKLTPEARNSALAIIFGSRAIAGANVLYKEGAKGITDWTNSVNDSGFAAKQAAGKMDNLTGDASKLGAAFNADIITAGSGANDTLRALTQGATGVTAAIGDIPAPVLAAGLGLVALVGVVALAGGTALTVVPKIAAMKVAMAELNISSKGTALGVGAASGALAAAGFAFALWAAQEAKAKAAASEFTDSLDKGTGALTGYSRELVAKKLADADAFKAAKAVGISQQELTDAVLSGGAALDHVKAKIGGNTAIWKLFSDQGWNAATALKAINDEGAGVATGKKNFHDLAAATGESAKSTGTAAAALDDLAGKSVTATGDIKSLADAIKGFGSAQLDVNGAERDFQAAIDDVTKSVKDNGTSLDIGTDAGRQNQASLDAIAKTALSAASAIVTQTGSQEDATKAVQDGRDALIVALGQFGITGAAAQTYADKLGLIPRNVGTAVVITGVDDASAKIDALRGKLEGIAKYKTDVQVTATQNLKGTGALLKKPSANGNMFLGGTAQAFAGGGIQSGIYSGRPGGLYKFAEPETGWEAFISGKPGQNARNRSIWADAGNRLGIQAPSNTTTHTVHAPITVNQVVDPIGTAMAVQRRLQGKAA